MDRRTFIKAAAAAGATVNGLPGGAASAAGQEAIHMPHQGPKPVVRGMRAVASSQHPIVTETMLTMLKNGGNAVDAALAGAITQATVQLDMTNHTGTVSFLYWEAKTGKTYYLNSMGTLVAHLPPFRTYPFGLDGIAAGAPLSCIPGFMPGVAAIHAKFGTKPWRDLVEPAIPWAENGHPMDEFTRSVLEYEINGNTFFPSMRAVYAPNGFTPSVGDLWKNPALATTLRRLADEGPDYFTTGEWAQHFVATANQLGWAITLADLTATPPRWQEPMRWPYKDFVIVQPPPPERQGLFCALVMGMLNHLDIVQLGHYTESAETLFYFAQAMRRAEFELGTLWDPEYFEVPMDTWTSDAFHAHLANILKRSLPKAGVDLTKHTEFTSAKANLQAFGWSTAGPATTPKQPAGSCELTCVDEQGNWVQMMDTLQSGGIAGVAVDGVPMCGSHVIFDMQGPIAGWLGVPGFRMRSVMGNTIVLRSGKPVLSMGTPGNVHCTIPQVLSTVLDYGKDPYEAATLPRLLPMRSDFTIEMETRLSEKVLRDVVKLGAKLKPLPPFDFHMGSFQQAWRDPTNGTLSASTDPRRSGAAGGL